jgi:RND family efflux transporter MFP subunit
MRQAIPGLLVWLLAAPAGASDADLECLIQPQQTVTLSFPVEGVVEEVLVDRGDLVKEGQELARLLADVERASLEVAKARAELTAAIEGGRVQLEYTARSLERQAELEKQEIVSEELMDQARREKRLAEAGMIDAREAKKVASLEARRASAVLAMRTVRSPFDGVVVKRILSQGEWADPPQILELAQIDPLRVEVFAPLRLFGKIEVGESALVTVEEPVGGSHQAQVTVVDRVVDAASGTFGVRLALPNPEYALPAGVRCRVRFATSAGPPRRTTSPKAELGELKPLPPTGIH